MGPNYSCQHLIFMKLILCTIPDQSPSLNNFICMPSTQCICTEKLHKADNPNIHCTVQIHRLRNMTLTGVSMQQSRHSECAAGGLLLQHVAPLVAQEIEVDIKNLMIGLPVQVVVIRQELERRPELLEHELNVHEEQVMLAREL